MSRLFTPLAMQATVSAPPPISLPVSVLPVSAQPDAPVRADDGAAPVPLRSLGRVPPPEPAAAPDTSRWRAIAETDLRVYPLALGCSVFGWTADVATSLRILDRHRELGGNFLDTADSYAAGRSEYLIGSWLRTRRGRDKAVVATKIGRNRDNPGLSPASIIGAVHDSLQRLGTDYIDLLYFHVDDTSVPLEESLGTVDALIRSGKVRHLAAANYSAERLIEARVLAANGLPRFVALQTHYNLVHREEYESSVALVAHAQGLGVLPYFALAHGFLTGKYRTKADVPATARGARAASYLHHRSLRVLGVLDRIAADRGVPSTTVALAWLLARDEVVAPVAGASHPDQLEALVAAADIRLARADMAELDRVSAQAEKRSVKRPSRR